MKRTERVMPKQNVMQMQVPSSATNTSRKSVRQKKLYDLTSPRLSYSRVTKQEVYRSFQTHDLIGQTSILSYRIWYFLPPNIAKNHLPSRQDCL